MVSKGRLKIYQNEEEFAIFVATETTNWLPFHSAWHGLSMKYDFKTSWAPVYNARRR